jgi:hypothetical protein
MMSAVDTMYGMATEPKRGPGRPQGRKPTHTIHTGISVEVGKALLAYMRSYPYPPRLRDVTEDAYITLLKAKGFWPLPEEAPKKKNGGHK